MTEHIMKLTLLVLMCWAIADCDEATKTSKTELALDISESRYDKSQFKARYFCPAVRTAAIPYMIGNYSIPHTFNQHPAEFLPITNTLSTL